jgi:beta-lactamase regulating signal transducer with metallopeptidase domain
MLLAWMAYSMLFGALAYGGALAGERLASIWERSSRFIWFTAAVAAVVVPILFATRPRVTAASAPAQPGIGDSLDLRNGIVSFAHASSSPVNEPLVGRTRRILATSNDAVLTAWVIVSLGCLTLIARAAAGIRRRRARWHEVDVDGIPVLVAPDVGPAVVGAFSPRIVIPRWALSLDPSSRELMLRHEAEHIRSRDPLLVFVATTATALLPWNAALWLVVRRLRLAIEIDCDQRVLRSAARAREYGELLLTVGARLSAPLPFATSLAERRPFLERRIQAMTALSPKHPRLVAAGCIALVAVASTAAVRAPRPVSLIERTTAPAPRFVAPAMVADSRLSATSDAVPPATITPSRASSARNIAFAEARVAPLRLVVPAMNPDSLTVAEIRALIEAHHPTVLAGDPSINTITLVVDARGNYVVSTAESRPLFYEVPAPGGRGARGRSGGVAPSTAPGGGDVGFARGRVGGGLREVPVPQDSVAMRARETAMAAERLAKIRQEVGDTAYGRQVKEEKRTQLLGDSLILQERKTFVLGDAFVRREGPKPMTDDQLREVGTKVGLNMDVLSRLIDPQSINAVQINTFGPGQLGTTALRVYVVHQRP